MKHSPKITAIELVLDKVRAACIFFASSALVVLVITFGWLVFGRYVLNATPTWVEQLALLLICYIAFWGAAAGIKEDTHLGVTLFRDMMPMVVQKVLLISIDIMLAAFGAIMVFAGIKLMSFGWDTLLPMLNIPESYRTLAITSCGAFIFFFAGARGVLRILTFSSWNKLDQEMDT
ncbi:MAG: TRAP transporter small permease [Pacificibacter sp.]|uniref:TRAP transporter small permease n=1 Tax=Pacificibacter sp. TaxID=1917866 RepID=UPI00321A50A5